MAGWQQRRWNRIIPRSGQVRYGAAHEATENKAALLYGAANNSDFAAASVKPEREVRPQSLTSHGRADWSPVNFRSGGRRFFEWLGTARSGNMVSLVSMENEDLRQRFFSKAKLLINSIDIMRAIFQSAFLGMSEECVWDESIRGSKTMWNRDWLFRRRPVRNRSKRTSIHHPTDRLVRCFLFGAFLSILSSVSVAQDPATVGQWSARTQWPYKAVHAAFLPTGKVLWWPSFDYGDNPYLWDPATNTNTALPQVGANIFCAGLSFLPNGTVLLTGGHIGSWTGLPNAYIFDPSTS